MISFEYVAGFNTFEYTVNLKDPHDHLIKDFIGIEKIIRNS